jgi:hypothetical protein
LREITDDTALPPAKEIAPVSFATLADDLQAVWKLLTTDARLRKHIVIREAIADVDPEAGKYCLVTGPLECRCEGKFR